MFTPSLLKRFWRWATKIKDPRLKWPVLAVLAVVIIVVGFFGWIANEELSLKYGQWREQNPDLTGMKLYWSDWGELTVWGVVAVLILLLIALMFWWLRRPIPTQVGAVVALDGGAARRREQIRVPAAPAHGEQELIFLTPEVEKDSTRRNAVHVVVSVRNERSTDAVRCRLEVDSVTNSSGLEQPFRGRPMAWATGQKEETITPGSTQRFHLARSYADTRKLGNARVTEWVFSQGRSDILRSFLIRSGGVFWISVQLSYSNAKSVYGVYRLDSTNLHDHFNSDHVAESDVVQFIRQFDKPPDLKNLISEYGRSSPQVLDTEADSPQSTP